MSIKRASELFGLNLLFLTAILAGSLQAQVEPDRSGVGQAEFRSAGLNIENRYRLPGQLPAQAYANAAADLSALGVRADSGFIETRGGRWATLIMAKPLLPGRGKGNGLSWVRLGRGTPANDRELSKAASQAFRDFLQANSHPLRIDLHELGGPGKVTVYRDGALIQIYIPRAFNGIPVRDSYISAKINHGNLILFGANNWGDIKTSTVPGIPASAATSAVQSHVGAYPISGAWGKTELVLVPVARGQHPNQVAVGAGYDYRLAWVIRPAFDGDLRHFEALVDARTGNLLSFEDTNQYAEVKGGVLPVSNDGLSPDGIEQPGWPMPFQDTSLGTTDTGGNVEGAGSFTASLTGPYVNINDNCGSHSLTQTDNIDWGGSGGTDCTTPGFGGAGNTHASRTGFYELNKIIEMGRSQLPGNTWLQNQLTSNMNINDTCNAYWFGGTVNFFLSGGGCSNTGEIAGVFDHEWGHGLDDNDAVPTIASPSGEGIADIYTALRLNDSCIGRNFRSTNCTGFGDPCMECTGVRDIDYLMRQSGNPHDYSWSNDNCGTFPHCIGGVYSEAVWSLWKRNLQSAPYNHDKNAAHEIVNRLTYIAAGNTGTWFSGGPPEGGCAETSGYMNYLAADDDNGDLEDGTPHMTAIYNAFNNQEIACQSPALTVQDSGCAGTPSLAPVVTALAGDKSVSLSWGTVTGTTSYEVFRTEGVSACDFGKVRLGETAGISWNDPGLQNGRDYYYVVIPKGSSSACFGPASNCASAAPVAGPNLDFNLASATLSISNGDGDSFIDNCENATLSFEVKNTGLGSLTDVTITAVTVVSPVGTTINDFSPVNISSSLDQGSSASGSFDFTAHGLAFGDTLVFEVSATADELSGDKSQTLTLEEAESNLSFLASKTWDFETDLDGWTTIEGTFEQTTAGGGAGGSDGYLASSAYLNDQCDQVRSPAFLLTSTSTLTLGNNYDIENMSIDPGGQWWDRANIAFFENGARNSVDPDGGRLYNASGPGATCATEGQNGWAYVNDSWGSSSWSAAALDSATRDGSLVQLDVAYGTDYSVNGKGFWFDKVTMTDIEVLVADGQSDSCSAGCETDSECSDGVFCNGAEVCNVGTCQAGGDPCPGLSCDEVGAACIPLTCDDDSVCESGESCETCGGDCPSFPLSAASCGNGLCEAGDGEDCLSCPADCNGKQNGKPNGRFCCGDGDGQNPISCSDSQCTSPGFMCTSEPQGSGDSTCCGDLTCEAPEEDSLNCALDCGAPPECGDGTCDPGEDRCSCAFDCGDPPSSESGMCADGVDNDCNLVVDCDDAACSGTSACSCGPPGESCSVNGECCSGKCRTNGSKAYTCT